MTLSRAGSGSAGAVEEVALRRPWRGWISAVAVSGALAVALALMALADVGPPVLRPERVLNVGSGSRPNHGGYGNALTTTTTTTTTTVPSSPLPPVRSGAVPRDNAEFEEVDLDDHDHNDRSEDPNHPQARRGWSRHAR
jgi:hypothetical protein